MFEGVRWVKKKKKKYLFSFVIVILCYFISSKAYILKIQTKYVYECVYVRTQSKESNDNCDNQ